MAFVAGKGEKKKDELYSPLPYMFTLQANFNLSQSHIG